MPISSQGSAAERSIYGGTHCAQRPRKGRGLGKAGREFLVIAAASRWEQARDGKRHLDVVILPPWLTQNNLAEVQTIMFDKVDRPELLEMAQANVNPALAIFREAGADNYVTAAENTLAEIEKRLKLNRIEPAEG